MPRVRLQMEFSTSAHRADAGHSAQLQRDIARLETEMLRLQMAQSAGGSGETGRTDGAGGAERDGEVETEMLRLQMAQSAGGSGETGRTDSAGGAGRGGTGWGGMSFEQVR